MLLVTYAPLTFIELFTTVRTLFDKYSFENELVTYLKNITNDRAFGNEVSSL